MARSSIDLETGASICSESLRLLASIPGNSSSDNEPNRHLASLARILIHRQNIAKVLQGRGSTPASDGDDDKNPFLSPKAKTPISDVSTAADDILCAILAIFISFLTYKDESAKTIADLGKSNFHLLFLVTQAPSCRA